MIALISEETDRGKNEVMQEEKKEKKSFKFIRFKLFFLREP